jgi:putative spermidine/putrescine transport system permease protein
MSWLTAPASATQIPHRSRLWLYTVAGLVVLFLVLPTLVVVPMSFSSSQYLEFPPSEWSLRWYKNYIQSGSWLQATTTSLKLALSTAVVATPLGTMAAYGLFSSRLRLGRLIMVLLLAPIITPVILVGIAVFYVYVRLHLVNTLIGLVLAHAVLALPLVVIVISSALASCDPNQEMAARSLGASRLKAFLLITLPQIRFALITAALISFLTSFDEVVIAMFVSGGANSTLTRDMFNALRDQVDPTIAAISTGMVVVSSLLLTLFQLFGQRSDRTTARSIPTEAAHSGL